MPSNGYNRVMNRQENTEAEMQFAASPDEGSQWHWADLAAMRRLLRLWIERRRQRSSLARLEDHELRDIGKTREEALREAAKPFWR